MCRRHVVTAVLPKSWFSWSAVCREHDRDRAQSVREHPATLSLVSHCERSGGGEKKLVLPSPKSLLIEVVVDSPSPRRPFSRIGGKATVQLRASRVSYTHIPHEGPPRPKGSPFPISNTLSNTLSLCLPFQILCLNYFSLWPLPPLLGCPPAGRSTHLCHFLGLGG